MVTGCRDISSEAFTLIYLIIFFSKWGSVLKKWLGGAETVRSSELKWLQLPIPVHKWSPPQPLAPPTPRFNASWCLTLSTAWSCVCAFLRFLRKERERRNFFLVMVNSIPTHGFTVNTGGQWSRGWEIGSSSISSSGPWAEQPGSTVPCCFIPSSCGWQAPERGREEGVRGSVPSGSVRSAGSGIGVWVGHVSLCIRDKLHPPVMTKSTAGQVFVCPTEMGRRKTFKVKNSLFNTTTGSLEIWQLISCGLSTWNIYIHFHCMNSSFQYINKSGSPPERQLLERGGLCGINTPSRYQQQ